MSSEIGTNFTCQKLRRISPRVEHFSCGFHIDYYILKQVRVVSNSKRVSLLMQNTINQKADRSRLITLVSALMIDLKMDYFFVRNRFVPVVNGSNLSRERQDPLESDCFEKPRNSRVTVLQSEGSSRSEGIKFGQAGLFKKPGHSGTKEER